MTTLAEAQQKTTYKICAFGRAKVGKSVLIGQLARIGKLHWFDLEDGVKSLLNPALLPKEYWGNINVFRIPSMQHIPMGIETILKVIKGTECRICWTHGKVECQICARANATINTINLSKFTQDDWLVIDSVTQLSSDANAAVLKFIFASADTPEQFVLDKDTGGKDFKYPMAIGFMLDKIFSTVQNSNFNCAVISHETMIERTVDTGKALSKGQTPPGDSIEIIVPTAGSRNFSRNFGRYFDMLINCIIENRKHKANSSTVASMNVQTGSRLPYNIEEMKNDKGELLPSNEAIVEIFKRLKTNANIAK